MTMELKLNAAKLKTTNDVRHNDEEDEFLTHAVVGEKIAKVVHG